MPLCLSMGSPSRWQTQINAGKQKRERERQREREREPAPSGGVNVDVGTDACQQVRLVAAQRQAVVAQVHLAARDSGGGEVCRVAKGVVRAARRRRCGRTEATHCTAFEETRVPVAGWVLRKCEARPTAHREHPVTPYQGAARGHPDEIPPPPAAP